MPDSAPNRRRVERVSQDQKVKLTPCSSEGVGTPIEVALRDFSPRGIGFLHDAALAQGQQLIVTLEQRIGNAAHLLYQVVRCNPSDGKWWIGAEFLCIVSDEELRARRLPQNPPGRISDAA